jgi:hypothetical protein
LKETESTESWFARRVEEELKDLANEACNHLHVVITFAVVFTVIVLYLVAHQMVSTGFFTATFGTLEMLVLYGSLMEWIAVAALEALGLKHLACDIDAFGGIIFVTIGGIWLLVVFPFEFAYFADVLPVSLRFLEQWISNDIARGVIVLWTVVNGIAAVYYGVLRVFVRKAPALHTGKTS